MITGSNTPPNKIKITQSNTQLKEVDIPGTNIIIGVSANKATVITDKINRNINST